MPPEVEAQGFVEWDEWQGNLSQLVEVYQERQPEDVVEVEEVAVEEETTEVCPTCGHEIER